MTEAAAEIMDYRERFVGFLKSFQDKSAFFKYRESIATLATQGKASLVIDFDDLISFDPDLAHDLKEKPNELLPKFNSAIGDAMRVENMQYASKVKAFRARFRKLDEVIPLRTLKSYHMGKLIMVEGIITRASGVKQLLKSAMFQCPRCGEKMIVDQTGSVLVPPPQCANQDCARKGFFRLITEESAFVDWQLISIQEKPEELPPGQLPRTVEGMLQGDIVDLSRPGDRISMVGVLQAKQEFTSKGFRLATFSSGVDANYLEVSERGSEELNISPDDEKKIKALAKDPQLYTKLIGSIAPSIYGYDEIKEAVAYQLVGGVSKNFSDIRIRGDINLLLVGDPGTAKSQLLQYVSKIAPRGVYTSGKGSTAAGLTATVVRDKNTGEFFLEAGALVIADKGIACLHPDCHVLIDGEQVRIGDLAARLAFEPIIAGNALSEVAALGKPTMSLNLNGMSIGWKEVTRVRRKLHSGQIIKLHLKSGSVVKVTPDHLLLDSRALAWKRSSDLGVGDALVASPSTSASKKAEGGLSSEEITLVEREEYDGYVYDLMMVDEPHNYFSDGVFSHNCIDEIDKMRPEDRSAIHEAMEQQSYHPSFEITFADGKKNLIGEFVDGLMAQYAENKVQGINCEILDTRGMHLAINTTDFRSVYAVNVDRVSRHKAPDHFIKITYSNGRSITVTPEHPIFTFKNGKIDMLSAETMHVGDFAPTSFSINYSGHDQLQAPTVNGRKPVLTPSHVTAELAAFLGYYASEGYNYSGSTKEVGLSNTSPTIIEEMKSCIQSSFNVAPIDYTKQNRTLRIPSTSIYSFMQDNFPHLFVKSHKKRIPHNIFCADLTSRVAFARAAFLGDGGVEPTAICYRTISHGLAEDYQDLLSSLGIHSRINIGRSNNSFKVYVVSDSLMQFAELMGPGFVRRIKCLLDRQTNANRSHDILPPHIGALIRNILKKIGLPYNGYFQQHLCGNYGVTRKVLADYLKIINYRISCIEQSLNETDLKKFRTSVGYSQDDLARLLHTKRGKIAYAENEGYTLEARSTILDEAKGKISEVLNSVHDDLHSIETISKNRWLRVRKVETIPNSGMYRTDFVYDVTVEPTHTFISNGLILHNTISIAKAGIVVQLNARSSILAAANPTFGRYVPQRSIAENISDLPVTILSRFDLIFRLIDRPEEVRDRNMTEHILKLHQGIRTSKMSLIEPSFLKKYIYYIRQFGSPVLGDAASGAIQKYFLETRAKGQGADSPVPITMRQLEAAIRLSEARAKLALKKEVTEEDVNAATRLLKACLADVGTDSQTGNQDIDVIMVGHSKTTGDKMQIIFELYTKMERENEGRPVKREQFVSRAVTEGMNKGFVEKLIGDWIQQGILYEPHSGELKKV